MVAKSVARRLLALICLSGMAALAQAGDLRVRITDAAGVPVEDAVISLHPLDASPAPTTTPSALMDQRGLRFVPFVLPVRAGTSVTFPNSDNVRHHVYSFSLAKRFELRLYAGNHASAVQFEQPGIVTLGCNIHDWMVGYIYVLDTPYFAKTGSDGMASLDQLPMGNYVARLWHPRIVGAAPIVVEQQLTVNAAALQRDYQLHLHAPDQSNMPPANLEMGLGNRMHMHGA